MFVPSIIGCNSIRKCRFFRKQGTYGFCQLARKQLQNLHKCPKIQDSPQEVQA